MLRCRSEFRACMKAALSASPTSPALLPETEPEGPRPMTRCVGQWRRPVGLETVEEDGLDIADPGNCPDVNQRHWPLQAVSTNYQEQVESNQFQEFSSQVSPLQCDSERGKRHPPTVEMIARSPLISKHMLHLHLFSAEHA